MRGLLGPPTRTHQVLKQGGTFLVPQRKLGYRNGVTGPVFTRPCTVAIRIRIQRTDATQGKVFANFMTDNAKRNAAGHATPHATDNKDFDKEALPDKIGSSLRQLYDEVLSEDVPDDFLALLRKADSKGPAAGKRAGSEASE